MNSFLLVLITIVFMTALLFLLLHEKEQEQLLPLVKLVIALILIRFFFTLIGHSFPS